MTWTLDSRLTEARHLKYTVPPAILLTLVSRPLITRLDVYKILFLITVCVIMLL